MTEPSHALIQAAEMIREVNHVSAHHSAYTYPSHVYDGIGAIAALLLERLAQATHQHAGWIATETDRGGIRIVSDEYTGDPPAAAAAIEHHTGQAAGAMLDAARELRAAHNIGSTMASTREVE